MANMQDMLGKTPEQMEIARRYRMADVLRKQAEEPMQGQMVSGHYVAPSWTQGLAKMLSAYGSGKMERDAAEAAKAYGEQQRTDFTDTAAKYAQALRGTPEQQTAYEADNPFGEDLGNLQTVTPGTPGDPNQALAIALQSKSQPWQQFAMQNMLAQAKGANDTAEMRNWRFAQSLSEADRAAFLAKSGTMPSSVQEWEYFNKLSPEQKAAYLEMKRNPQIMNLGGTMAVRAPGGGVGESYAVTPKPEAMPAFKAEQTTAVKGAERAIEKKSEAPKAKMALDAFESKAKNLDRNVNDAINQAGFWTTGFIGNQAKKISGTKAFDLSAKLDSIKANLGFSELQAMRDSSPTGGALGSITERELALLQSAWASVEQAQSKEAFVKALQDVQRINKEALERAKEAYRQTYGGAQSGNRPPLDSLWD